MLILHGDALGSYGGRWEHSGEDQHGAVWVHVDRPNQRLYVRDYHWCLGKVNSHGYYLADFMMPHSGGVVPRHGCWTRAHHVRIFSFILHNFSENNFNI